MDGFRGFQRNEGSEFPLCRAEDDIDRGCAAVGRLLQRDSGPIFPLIEDLFGLSIVVVRQEIAAVLIPAELAVRAGTPALEVDRARTTSDGAVAQVAVNTHPASRFWQSMTLRRVRG